MLRAGRTAGTVHYIDDTFTELPANSAELGSLASHGEAKNRLNPRISE